jgi:outer membrane protein assembly factor BamA
MQNGDIKFVCNVEYRRQLFGSLHGAVFLDAGNVWTTEEEFGDDVPGYGTSQFKLKDMFNQMAVGTGIGLRYDMDFLVLRLDWGVALHLPYTTEKSGFYNVPSFKGSHTLHFAIGYPF